MSLYQELLFHFHIVDQYAILDYFKINEGLHQNQLNAKKYLLPISKYYIDYYGNYGILLLISKKDISYLDLCIELCQLKRKIRNMLKKDYFSFVFYVSKLGERNYKQTIEILSYNGKIINKDSMNQKGTFMIFSINEIHSPDVTLEDTINEIKLLASLNVFDENNKIGLETLNKIRKYKTFEFLKYLK